MKQPALAFIICIAVGLASCSCFKSCRKENKVIQIENVDSLKQANDSLQKLLAFKLKSYQKSNDSLQTVINDLQLDIDKYQFYTDSIADELLVSNYKLERIKYYNSIAKGNNLSFLRGWINRVINE